MTIKGPQNAHTNNYTQKIGSLVLFLSTNAGYIGGMWGSVAHNFRVVASRALECGKLK